MKCPKDKHCIKQPGNGIDVTKIGKDKKEKTIETGIKLEPWNERTIPKNRPLYICERTPSFGNKWDEGLSNLVVAITAAGIKMVQCDGSIKSVAYDQLAECWMEVDGSVCGRLA